MSGSFGNPDSLACLAWNSVAHEIWNLSGIMECHGVTSAPVAAARAGLVPRLAAGLVNGQWLVQSWLKGELKINPVSSDTFYVKVLVPLLGQADESNRHHA